MRERVPGAVLFVAASLANLPLVHALVRDGSLSPPVALAFGLLAMGLAWAGGFHLEKRKRWFVLIMGVVGVAEGAAPLVVPVTMPWAFVSAAFSLVALGLVLRVRPDE